MRKRFKPIGLILGLCLVLLWSATSWGRETILKLSPHVKPAHSAIQNASSLNPNEPVEQMDVYGVVVDVQNTGTAPTGGLLKPMDRKEVLQQVTVRLDTGDRSSGLHNKMVTVENILGENPAYNIPLKPGVRVLINMERNPATKKWVFYIANRDRMPALMILGTVMVLAILMIGGSEVCKHVLLATLMLLGAYKALFPAVLAGVFGLWWVFLMCFVFTILGSFIYQIPGTKAFSREQLIVILGTLGGLFIMAGIMAWMHEFAPLEGYSSEGLASLWYRSPQMDYWALFMATVLIGYQGFIFYLCWMLAQNRKPKSPEQVEVLSFWQRFDIVMLRGRRLLGPMLSSLGLLFLGLYLPILLQMQGTPTAQFLNLESTAGMLSIAFAGGLTLILTVPLTALLSAWLLSAQTEPLQPGKASLN